VKKGSNDDQLGRVIEFALKEPCVRGVTFQPIQAAGRVDDFDPRRHRLTLTDIRSRILEQSALFQPEDLIPVPCNPDTLCMGYAIKQDGRATPLTRFLDPERLVALQGNTILHEQDARLRQLVVEAFSTGHSPEGAADRLGQLLCCLTEIRLPQGLNYSNVFRVLIVQFLDRFTMDVRAVKRSCIHFATEDGRLIPFDTYNLFYREGLSLPPSALPLLTSAS
jgi:hypothetical protein